MIVDLTPSLNFLLRFLLIGVTAGLVAFVAVRYLDMALVGALWGVQEEAGCYILVCLGLVLVAAVVSYWVF